MSDTYERTKARKGIFGASIALIIFIFFVVLIMILAVGGGSGSGEGELILAVIGSILFLIGSVIIFFTWIVSAVFKLAKIDFDPFSVFEKIEFINDYKKSVVFLSFLVTFSVFALLEDSLHMKKEKEKLDQKK